VCNHCSAHNIDVAAPEGACEDQTDDQVVAIIAGATELSVADVRRVIDHLGTWEERWRFARGNAW
jgi:hypothetical protein